MRPLEGDVALVTGASRGLGLGFARDLAAAGASVALAARDRERLEAARATIAAAGGTAAAIEMDVTEPASVRAALDAAEAALGAVSVLVNNAGVAVDAPLFETTPEDWQRVIATNLTGAWTVAQETARRMAAHGIAGRIVNISSVLGTTATRRVHAYAAAKAGLDHLTRTLAVELARHGIRVNALAPGYVRTDLNRDLLDGPVGERLKARVPLGRFAEPADLTAPLLLLASPSSGYMTGCIITVDGGMSLSAL